MTVIGFEGKNIHEKLQQQQQQLYGVGFQPFAWKKVHILGLKSLTLPHV
jgi:hypothetical protein